VIFVLVLRVAMSPAHAERSDADALPRTAETIEIEGHKAYLYAAVKPAEGKPWVWYAPTLKGLSLAQRKAYFESFLRAGVSVAGFDLGEVRGSPASTAKFTQFYHEIVNRGWSSRPILLGQSRGGLMMLAWAMRHPDKTRAFVGIYPVCNLETWPMKNKSITLADYGLTEAQFRAKLTEFNPLDNLRGLQKHKVPMFVVHGDSDAAVPYDENTRLLKERYEAGGGPINVKLIAGEGHKVSPAFFECRELIEFVLKQAVESNLEVGFRNPPQQAKPLVWWDWINGSVTKAGIKADLESMKRAGIGGVQLFDLELYMPKGPVRYGTDTWHEHVQYAIETADSLGLEFHVMNCAGWSASGGPWITPDKSMKRVIWSEENVVGSKNFVQKLKRPTIEHRGGRDIKHNFYRDICILAVPADQGTPYRLPEADKKIGISPPTFKRPVHSPDKPDRRAVPRNKVLDLSKNFKEGVLSCDLPEGNWTVIRFGFTSTGSSNHPAVPEGHGLEVDKFDPKAVEFQFRRALGRIVSDATPHLGRTLKGILFDSFEGGFQNWTDRFPEQFKAQNGYDLLPYLPVLTGRVIESAAVSEAVLYDFRGTIDRLLAENYFGVMQRLAHEHRLILNSESQGGPLNPVYCNEYVDVPMNEFWVGNYVNRIEKMKLSASSANLYGRQIVGAESFTAVPDDGKWQNTPYSLKVPGDCAFTAGINRFIFHTYIHQPYSHLKPGFTMGRYGTHFGRQNTWWEFAPAWIDYLSRSQFLLQQGTTVTDIGFLFHNDIRYAYPAELTKTPDGYDYVVCYPKNLASMQYQDGQVVVLNGPAFRILVLPDHPFMSVDTLQHVSRLLKSGATVVGNRPAAPPGMRDVLDGQAEFTQLVSELWGGLDPDTRPMKAIGKGKLFLRKPLEHIASQIGLTQDVSFMPEPDEGTIRYIHRRTEAEDIYFVCNQSDHPVELNAQFRVTGRMPELWDPATGNRWKAGSFVVNADTTSLPLQLERRGSIFVVFRQRLPEKWITSVQGDSVVRLGGKLLASSGGNIQVHYSDKTKHTSAVGAVPPAIPITGPWQVKFLDGRGAPAETRLESLISWTELPDKNVRYYSGIAEYLVNVDLPKSAITEDERFVLSLGQVYDIAQVSVNGSVPTILWKEPFQSDVTEYLKVGENTIVIKVANRWINRLIGDEQFPADCRYQKGGNKFTAGRILEFPKWLNDPAAATQRERFTFATWRHYSEGSKLVPSGLLGPVKFAIYRDVGIEQDH
jgi:predicted esterase